MSTNRSEIKKKALAEKGGKCMLCGYSRCTSALQFHHINPFEKDKDLSRYSSWKTAKEELKKCVLVCSNCHSEIHAGFVDHEVLFDLGQV
jgi:5-methylcytosine-specific restriction endonuclease McrA